MYHLLSKEKHKLSTITYTLSILSSLSAMYWSTYSRYGFPDTSLGMDSRWENGRLLLATSITVPSVSINTIPENIPRIGFKCYPSLLGRREWVIHPKMSLLSAEYGYYIVCISYLATWMGLQPSYSLLWTFIAWRKKDHPICMWNIQCNSIPIIVVVLCFLQIQAFYKKTNLQDRISAE